MKKLLLIAVMILSFISCKQSNTTRDGTIALIQNNQEEYRSFGEKISSENSISAQEMKQRYNELNVGDTILAKFSTTVKSVCKMKGCWMTLDLPGAEEEPMVKFKDYAFFVPRDIEGREVIVEGIAFVEETPVEDLKHFAMDAGKSQEDIDKISQPEKTLSFLAHGVLLKE